MTFQPQQNPFIMTTVDLFVLALPAIFTVGAFYFAGELIRRRMQKGGASSHRLLDDLRGLENAFVDFFGSSKTSSGTLNVLAMHSKPIGFRALAAEVRGKFTSSIDHDDVPLMAIRAVLRILLFSRLARMSVHGFAITELGREVHRRMRARGGVDNSSQSGGLPEKVTEVLANQEYLPQTTKGHSAHGDSSPWIGKFFEDPSVAAAIGEVEERFSTRNVKHWRNSSIKPFREGYELIAVHG